jgi:FdhD protein
MEYFQREKCDLSLVIVSVIEKSVVPNAMPGHALNRFHFDQRIVVRFATVMSKEIMAAGDVKMTDFHRGHDNITLSFVKQNGIGSGQIIRRKRDGSLEYLHDDLTVEEPLEIRIGDKTVAITMRTPGHDDELAAGFLLSEAIVRDRSVIREISINGDNRVVVAFAEAVKPKFDTAQRFGTISSSCGLCGKKSIEEIRQNFPAIGPGNVRIDIQTLVSLPEKLRKAQSDFARTGGIHAAGIFDSSGDLKTVREDIGRHNAVDKAIGRAFLDNQLPLNRSILLVSGRASFEILQKALAAGIPIVASVSAPSTLAVNFARESNQTLVGFLRPPSFNVYTHIERVILDSA